MSDFISRKLTQGQSAVERAGWYLRRFQRLWEVSAEKNIEAPTPRLSILRDRVGSGLRSGYPLPSTPNFQTKVPAFQVRTIRDGHVSLTRGLPSTIEVRPDSSVPGGWKLVPAIEIPLSYQNQNKQYLPIKGWELIHIQVQNREPPQSLSFVPSDPYLLHEIHMSLGGKEPLKKVAIGDFLPQNTVLHPTLVMSPYWNRDYPDSSSQSIHLTLKPVIDETVEGLPAELDMDSKPIDPVEGISGYEFDEEFTSDSDADLEN